MKVILIGFIILYVNLAHGLKCPSEETIFPCKCGDVTEDSHKVRGIDCAGIEVKDETLKKLFQETSPGPATLLTIHNTSVTKIDKGTFDNHQFFEIHISHNKDLEYIDPSAFKGSKASAKYIFIHNNEKLTESDKGDGTIFDVIKNFDEPHIVNLSLNGIEKIPAEAFSFKGKTHLTHIDLHGNKIKSIGKDAFLELEVIETIDLNENKIDTIEGHAFTFKSTAEVRLDLSKNNLTSTSFAADTFAESMANGITLTLDDNQITYLSEEAFKSFVKKENTILAENNKFKCDCKMKWIVEMIDKFEENGGIPILSIQCQPQDKQIIALFVEDLEKCEA